MSSTSYFFYQRKLKMQFLALKKNCTIKYISNSQAVVATQYSIFKNTLQFITVANLQLCHSNGNRFMVWGHLNMRNSPSFPCHLFIKIDGKKTWFLSCPAHLLICLWCLPLAVHSSNRWTTSCYARE